MRRNALRSCVLLSAAAVGAGIGACKVDVPDPGDGVFACRDNVDCADGYYCQRNTSTTSGVGSCAKGDSNTPVSTPCGTGSCVYPLVCGNKSGTPVCGECRQYGCGSGEICVQSVVNGAQSRCVKQCYSLGVSCTGSDSSGGWCLQVPGYPTTSSTTTQPVLACATCGTSCSDCRRSSAVTSYDNATYCNGSASQGCRYSGCPLGNVCVESRSGSPSCMTGCSSCAGGACVPVNRAFDSAGTSIGSSVCVYCNSGCGTGTCVGNTVDYAADAAPYCSAPAGQCDMSLSCRDASDCMSGYCSDGTTCTSSRSCPAGQLCYPDQTCRSASCTTDASCPPTNWLCGIDDMCGYAPTAWYGLGGSESSGLGYGSVEAPAIVVTPGGVPMVAWLNRGTGQVFATAWDPPSATWTWLSDSGTGGSVNTSPASDPPALAVDSNGQPIVAWIEGQSVYVKRWVGSSWQTFDDGTVYSGSGPGLSVPWSNMVASDVQLALDSASQPVVAWRENDGLSPALEHVYLRWWTGSWQEVSGSGSGSGVVALASMTQLTLAVANNGSIAVAWTEVPTGSANTVINSRRSANWGPWNPLNTVQIGGFDAWEASLQFTTSNELMMAWVESDPPSTSILYVQQWNDTSGWSSFGNLSTNGPAAAPQLTQDANGNLLLAYQSGLGTTMDIHLRQWKSNTWNELHSSDTGAGVSLNSSEVSSAPSVGAARDVCVAWVEGMSPSARILVRCHP